MVAYEFYFRDPIKGHELLGVLPERRKNTTRITRESVMKWGRKYLNKEQGPYDMFFTQVEIGKE